jgi:uncharacterized protein
MKKWIVIAALIISGCSFLKKSKPTMYSLETLPGVTENAGRNAGAPLGIEAIELPPGIDRRELVVRNPDRKLEMRGDQLWGGPLEDMVIHTLAFDLAKRLPEGSVVLPGQIKPAAMRPVVVIFEDLAANQNREFVLDARWTLAGVSHHERIVVPISSTEGPEIVRGMSQALAQLADKIAGL